MTTDGTVIYSKGWGASQRIVFSHGWPLSADDWDTQMLFFLQHGYRVIAHDRRGHGRSTQTSDGHDMDHYADDLAALTAHLDLKDAVHVGHSSGCGEDGEKSRRSSKRSVLWIAGAAGCQPSSVLLRSAGGSILWLQPVGRQSFGADHLELVAPGHDGRREGALRWDRRLLTD